VDIHAQVDVGEGSVVEGGGRPLAAVLAAGVAPRLDTAEQALLEVLGGIGPEGTLERESLQLHHGRASASHA
jgi:hypothetical protein